MRKFSPWKHAPPYGSVVLGDTNVLLPNSNPVAASLIDSSVSLVWNIAPEPGYTILTCVLPAVYPIPLLDTVILVTMFDVRSTVANAVAPTPSPVIITSGGPKYALPPNVTIILSIFPFKIDGYATAPLPLIRLIVGS